MLVIPDSTEGAPAGLSRQTYISAVLASPFGGSGQSLLDATMAGFFPAFLLTAALPGVFYSNHVTTEQSSWTFPAMKPSPRNFGAFCHDSFSAS